MEPFNHAHNPSDEARSGARLRVLPESATSPGSAMTDASQVEISDAVETQVRKAKADWAGEIHDGLTQTVIAAVLELESLSRQKDADPDVIREALVATAKDMRLALADLRGVLFELAQPADAVTSFDAAVEEVARRWEISPDVRLVGTLDNVPANVEHAAQVVIREALTNAAKHAGSKHISVRVIASPDDLHVQVEDHGRGMSGEPADGEQHFGMRMMRRRVEELGGRLVIHSDEQHGTLVDAHLPCRRSDRR